MAGTSSNPAKQSLGSYAGLDGQPLDLIDGQTVTVARIQVMTRRLRDVPEHAYAIITLDTGAIYHTWSEYLCEQLAAVPLNALPDETTFRKIKTDKNREVWKMD